jgi:NAD(P)-dependent dehydrogenase (short-subunit alcohol dehydrogenase family)
MQPQSIVTGAASGIGHALAAALVERGHHVVLADVDDGVHAVADTLAATGPGSARSVVVDVADADAVDDLVRGSHRDHGRLDQLFNNAGIGPFGEPEELTLAHWNRTIDVNLRGVIHGCHAAYPLMKDQGFGHIINTASLAGLVGGLATAAPYAATKYGVVGLSLALHVAGADHGVGVHVVCPGGIDTPILDRDEVPGLPTPPGMRGVTMRTMNRDVGVPVRNYPPERLAQDILRGVARDRPLIVAPFSAGAVWRMFRLAPGPMLKGSVVGARRLRSKQAARRAAGTGGETPA